LIVRDFILPEFRVGLGNGSIFATFVMMPETPVDEDDRLGFSKDNIGLTWKIGTVNTIPVSPCIQGLSYLYLGLGVLGMNL